MSFWSEKHFFRKKKTRTTNGRKNAETACPKTIQPITTSKKTITTNANQISNTIFLRKRHDRHTVAYFARLRQRAWDCPLYGFFGYRLFFRFFTRFSRCFTWFFVTFRICYKCFTSTETTRVSFVLGLWVCLSIRTPRIDMFLSQCSTLLHRPVCPCVSLLAMLNFPLPHSLRPHHIFHRINKCRCGRV